MTRFGPFAQSQAADLSPRQRRELLTVLHKTVYRIPDGHSPGKPSYGGLHGNAVNGLERRRLICPTPAELFRLTEEGWLALRETGKTELGEGWPE